MAINFREKLAVSTTGKKKNPIEIYENLDRTSLAGPLRESQISVLKEWYENRRADKDVVIKLHTGEGKTLIGLLILMSRINETKTPGLYICPNKYLVEQVCQDAVKFGVPVCTIGEEKEIPNEFLNCERILVTTVQKVFNGKTVFKLGNKSINVGTVVLDDAHACLDSIRDAFSVRISRQKQSQLYADIFHLFEDDLKLQGAGTLLDIWNEDDMESLMMIPYWTWIDKKDEVLSLLSSYSQELFLLFKWPLIRDCLDKCQAFVTGKEIQISPIVVDIDRFGSFANANARIMMSATTQDDVFFIKTLGMSTDAILNPLISKSKKWSGEKMVLLPSLISDELTREEIIYKYSSINYKFGAVSLVPSNKHQRLYEDYGCQIINTDNITEGVRYLQETDERHKLFVFANRYDGIDLPDSACRLLIIDSLPVFQNMEDTYEEKCCPNGTLVNKKIAQKIEQGMGRCVRSEKDYACILVIGDRLVNFIRNNKTRNYFSEQTCKQVEIGLQVAEWSKEDSKDEKADSVLIDLINQCLKRDEGWKEYYKNAMDEINPVYAENVINYERIRMEHEADKEYFSGNYGRAEAIIQRIADESGLSEAEKGWYLQKLARIKYHINRVDSAKCQQAAFKKNFELLKPKEELKYSRFDTEFAERTEKIKQILNCYSCNEDLVLEVADILEELRFGVSSDKFEKAVDSVGRYLGFDTQRPDKESRVGPDNLWRVARGSYLVIECKNEVKPDRECIVKSEVGQMNTNCAWFKNEYPDGTSRNIMIIPTKEVCKEGDFCEKVFVVTKKELDSFKEKVRGFFSYFNAYDLSSVTSEVINKGLNEYNLDINSIINDYSVPVVKTK